MRRSAQAAARPAVSPPVRFKITLDRPKSAEKPVSLQPLAFREAVAALLLVPPPARSETGSGTGPSTAQGEPAPPADT